MNIHRADGINQANSGATAKKSKPNSLLLISDKVDISSSKQPKDGMLEKMQKCRAMAGAQSKEVSENKELQTRLDSLFKESKSSPNPVLASLEPVIRNARHIKIDMGKIKEHAKKLTKEDLKPSDWKFPAYIQEDSPKTIDFFMLMNSINFMFFDPKTGEKYQMEHEGIPWKGSTGMTASLKRAMDEEIPILDADYLSKIDEKKMKHIFRGNMEIPMMKERIEIFKEVGTVLKEKYDDSFENLAKAANYKAFDNGNGMVERLTRDFPSFKDESRFKPTGDKLIFNKRAQLAVAMLHTRLQGTGLFDVKDVGDLTVFADYQLPRGLRNMGILKYDDKLADNVDNQKEIKKDTRMEQEMRAFTVVAAKLLQDEINKRPDVKTDARGIDFLLWSNARKDKSSHHHMTVTTAY